MKSLFIVCMAVALITFAGCQKQEEATRLAASSITGNWELRAVQGGMLPGRELSPGNGTVLQFSATHYTRYENHAAVQTGTYTITEDSTAAATVGLLLPAGQFRHRIVLENDENKRPTFIHIEGNQLSLVTGYFPLDYGVLQRYEKIAVHY